MNGARRIHVETAGSKSKAKARKSSCCGGACATAWGSEVGAARRFILSRLKAATRWDSRIADSCAPCIIYSAGSFGHTGILERQAVKGKLRTITETKSKKRKDTRAVIDLFVRRASRPQRINSLRRARLLFPSLGR